MSRYFCKPYEHCGGNVKVEFDLSNYAAKVELKGAKGNDTSRLAVKSDLASLKSQLDKVNADRLKSVFVDIRKLSNVVDKDVVKKTVYDKLVRKVNAIDT